jgi:hypothetical protein
MFDKDAFVHLRRQGLGASDSAIYLGVNPYTTREELIAQKCSKEVTEEERAVGEKEVVRKGADLEPLILQKFETWSGIDTYKPGAMYRLTKHPQLTVNFDGIIELASLHIPVEIKYVSPYANKYWNRSKCINELHEGRAQIAAGISVQEHVSLLAELYGIPAYYFTQVQQQLLALDAPFGYVAAMFDKGWEMGVYKIFADKYTQMMLIQESENVWEVVEARKNG